MENGILEWVGFLAFVLAMLALDLGVFNRKDHVVGPREALGWSALWVSLALCFGGYVWLRFGSETGMRSRVGMPFSACCISRPVWKMSSA